jgi:hypothetical protein
MTTPDNTAATEAAQKGAQPRRAPKTFLQTLQDIHYGHFSDECTAKLVEAIAAAERTGKATSVTVKLDFKPVSKAAGRYNVFADVTNKLPPPERETAMMFVGPDGNLTNRDPRQMEIEGVRVVDGGTSHRVEDQPGTAVRVA